MKFALTTLSFGKNYTKDYALRLIEDVLNISNLEIFITTDCKDMIMEKFGINDRIKIQEISREEVTIRIPIGPSKSSDDFNFNMKYISLLPVVDLEDYVVIFTDCDNSFDWWDEEVITNHINDVLSIDCDFMASRTDWTWEGFMADFKEKNNSEHGIFWHKIPNYDLDEKLNIEWAKAPLPAEHVLIFINREKKLKKFCEQWKWFHDYLVNKDYSHGTWAEGFEIGVSSLVAGFKPHDIGWNHVIWNKIFTFNGYKTGPKSKGIHHPTERI
jgi:hypothetical protein